MATRAEIRTYAREQALLDSSDVADTILDTYLDRAVSVVGSRLAWPFLDGESTFETVIGTRNYSMPATAVKIESIVRSGSKVRLREVTSTQARQRFGDDPPTTDARSFFLWDDDIHLVEIPPSVETYKVYFRTNPTLMAADGESPEWDSQHHLFLADFLIARMWEREEDPRAAETADRRFDQGVADMAQFYLNQASDAPMVWGESADRAVGGYYGNMPWLDGV